MFNKIKNSINVVLLFLTAFLINFRIGLHVQGDEDFLDAIVGFRFLETFDFRFLMTEPHNSIDFITLPFYYIFGAELSVLRFVQAIFVGLSVVFFFLFSQNYFKDKIKALFTSLLLISVPLFILTVYHPEFPFLGFFATLSLYLIQKTSKEGGFKKIILLGFIIGIASFKKAIFLPYGALTLILFFIINHKEAKRQFTEKNITGLCLGFLVGFAPFLIHLGVMETDGSGAIISSILRFPSTFLENITYRLFQLGSLFSTPARIYGEKVHFHNLALLNMFFLGISTLYLALKKNKIALLIITPIAFTAASTIELINSSLLETHLYILIPVVVFLICVGVFTLTDDLLHPLKKRGLFVGLFIITILILINGLNSYHIYRQKTELDYSKLYMEISKSLGGYTDEVSTVYDLTDPEDSPHWQLAIPFHSKLGLNYYSLHSKKYGLVPIRVLNEKSKEENVPTNLHSILDKTEKNEEFVILMVDYLNNKEPEFDISEIENKISDGYVKVEILDDLEGVVSIIWMHESRKKLIEEIKEFK